MQDIPASTELTFNYQFESVGETKKACLCGAKNCSGFIGKNVDKPGKTAKKAKTEDDSVKKKKKKVKDKKTEKKQADKEIEKLKVWEDICYR